MLAILLVFSAMSGRDDPQAAVNKDLAKLEGTWRGVGGEESGLVQTREDVKLDQEEFVFKGRSLTFRKKGKVIYERLSAGR
jgi:hypothetical protein